MDRIRENYLKVIEKIQESGSKVNLIAVSKTKPVNDILELIKIGHLDFGENKLQEAKTKWPEIKKQYPQTRLHFIGHLQSNKIKEIVDLFDVIHTIDSKKHAAQIRHDLKDLNKPVFIEVNIGQEAQKRGCLPKETPELICYCREELGLNLIGLMCIPPASMPSQDYFNQLRKLAYDNGLKELSMGMSEDYNIAINNGATYIRLGTLIFGERK